MSTARLVIAAGFAFLLGCLDPVDEHGCTPRSLARCTCEDGREGEAVCTADGKAFGECVCRERACVPGTLAACTCDATTTGQRVCSEDGSGFGTCECSPGKCFPGTVARCDCSEGGPGQRLCAADGSGFGGCECSTGCAPNTLAICTCEEGQLGFASCSEDGSSYDTCQCEATRYCEDGSFVLCRCESGTVGQATCQNGAFGTCDCRPSTSTCTPRAVRECITPQGKPGLEQCRSDASSWSWGPCELAGSDCVPETIRGCTCSDGRPGQALCNLEGTAFGACECDGCVPGSVSRCTCSYNTPGRGICDAERKWSPCRCDVRTCLPGGFGLCSCDTEAGIQLCHPSGTSFLPCQCEETFMCKPGDTASCTCEDGARGLAQCQEGTGFSACVCEPGACVPGSRSVCLCEGGGAGISACSADGREQGPCTCEPACPQSQAQGVLRTSLVDVPFWGMPVASGAAHRIDVDPSEDGCMVEGVFTIGADPSCRLTIEFARANGAYGGLRRITFAAGWACPGIAVQDEGTYQTYTTWGSMPFVPMWFGGPARVDQPMASSVCLQTSITFPDRVFHLRHATREQYLTLNLKDLRFVGGLTSNGRAADSCLDTSGCGPNTREGGGGWCLPANSGTACVYGYQEGGDGSCAPTGTCAPNYHNGGDGKCVWKEACSSGFHDDGTGNCTSVSGCIPDYHDGGDGQCVPEGQCSTGFGMSDGCRRWRPTASSSLAWPTFPSASVVMVSGKVLVVRQQSAEFYDPSSETWAPTNAPPLHRQNYRLVSSGKEIFALGSDNYGSQGLSLEILDSASQTWRLGATPLTPVRSDYCALALLDGRVLVAGGTSYEHRMEAYSPETDTWEYLPGLSPVPRLGIACTLMLDGRVMVTGGGLPSYPWGATNSCEIYDPVSNRWTTCAPMGAPRQNHKAVTLLDGRVMVLGEYSEIYDPATNTWRTLARLNGPSLVGRMASGRVLVLISGTPHVLDLAPNSLFARSIGPTPGVFERMVPLTDGRILGFGSGYAALFVGGL